MDAFNQLLIVVRATIFICDKDVGAQPWTDEVVIRGSNEAGAGKRDEGVREEVRASEQGGRGDVVREGVSREMFRSVPRSLRKKLTEYGFCSQEQGEPVYL